MASKDDNSVLGNLPSTRPARMSRRREGASARGDAPVATKPKKAAPPKAKPKAAAAKPKPATTSSKPKAVRSGSPSLERAPRKGPEPPKPASSTPPKGTELVTTTVQAVGELAQIGLTLSGQVAKRALKRLPKP